MKQVNTIPPLTLQLALDVLVFFLLRKKELPIRVDKVGTKDSSKPFLRDVKGCLAFCVSYFVITHIDSLNDAISTKEAVTVLRW